MSQLGPRVIGSKQSTGANRLEFADGELSGDGTGTTMIPMTFPHTLGSLSRSITDTKGDGGARSGMADAG